MPTALTGSSSRSIRRASTDLDQAFAIEAAGPDFLLHYAIADVAWFVGDGDPLDVEAWARGVTMYLPGGKAGLYPPVLAEGAASLLPDGPRPAVVFSVRVAPDGAFKMERVERAVIRSRAKLAYETVRDDQLPPGFARDRRTDCRVPNRRAARRGSIRPNRRSQQGADGKFALQLRPLLPAETPQRGDVARLQHGGGGPAPGKPHRAVPGHGRAR